MRYSIAASRCEAELRRVKANGDGWLKKLIAFLLCTSENPRCVSCSVSIDVLCWESTDGETSVASGYKSIP